MYVFIDDLYVSLYVSLINTIVIITLLYTLIVLLYYNINNGSSYSNNS